MSTDLTIRPTTDPSALYRLRDGLYAADFLTAALVHLDLFTWLEKQGGATAREIEGHFGTTPRPTDVLLTLAKANGVLTEKDGRFELTKLGAEHYSAASPWYLGPYYLANKDRQGVKDLLEVLRTGRPVFWGGKRFDEDNWHSAMQEEGFAERFTGAMDCRGFLLGPAAAAVTDLSGTKRLLDIAGGSGIYACSFVAKNPHLQATVLEQPPVDGITRAMIAKRGFAERVSVQAGDMFKDGLPTGFDAHLWSNVLHDWDVPEVRQLLAASAASLPKGGLVIIHDTFLNEDKSGPIHVAEFSVTLAHATHGRCYGTGELRGWLEEAGFSDVTYKDTEAARGVMVARR